MSGLNSYFANSGSGPELEINEDSLIVDVRHGLFGIVDGYGGSGIGDRVAEEVKKTVLDSYGILSEDEDATLPLYFNPNYSIETNALINSLYLAHSKVKEMNNGKGTNSRGGASFLGGTAGEHRMQLVGTGNCMAICLRGESSQICYFPHTSAEVRITGEGGSQCYPSSGLGLFDDLEFFVQEVKTYPGDRVFLLSSGTYAPFNLTELSILLSQLGDRPDVLKNELFNLAKGRDSKANQSIVCLEF